MTGVEDPREAHDREVEALLASLAEGHTGSYAAVRELVGLIHEDIRRIARGMLGGRAGGGRGARELGTTVVVNEAAIRLLGQRTHPSDRHAYFAIVAMMVHRSIVKVVREARRAGRAPAHALPLPREWLGVSPGRGLEVAESAARAIERLAAINPRAAETVVMKVYSGLSLGEIASAVGWSENEARRHWRAGRAWLRAEIARGMPPSRPDGSTDGAMGATS